MRLGPDLYLATIPSRCIPLESQEHISLQLLLEHALRICLHPHAVSR